MNRQSCGHHKYELDNQDLSLGITLESKKYFLMTSKEDIERLDTLTDFHQVITLLEYL